MAGADHISWILTFTERMHKQHCGPHWHLVLAGGCLGVSDRGSYQQPRLSGSIRCGKDFGILQDPEGHPQRSLLVHSCGPSTQLLASKVLSCHT
ncbi:hypothetical protein GCM10025777_36220 [Membranihabitans marinus]